MCSAFTPNCGYDNSTIILIGDVYCPNTKCLGKLCPHKKSFQSRGRSDYECQQYAFVCQVRNIPFEEQTNCFFLSLGQVVYIFKENQKSVQDVIGAVYCPGEFCINRETCESFGGYVTTPRSIYGCGKCGAWSFVHKVPFTLQEHVKKTKTDKTRFLFAEKTWTCHPTNKCYRMFQFNRPNIKRKNKLCVDNIKTFGDVYCPTCPKCVYISTKKTTSFYDRKKCKACCHVLNIPFKDLKPTIMLFGGDGTHCLHESWLRKEKPSPFSKKFPR